MNAHEAFTAPGVLILVAYRPARIGCFSLRRRNRQVHCTQPFCCFSMPPFPANARSGAGNTEINWASDEARLPTDKRLRTPPQIVGGRLQELSGYPPCRRKKSTIQWRLIFLTSLVHSSFGRYRWIGRANRQLKQVSTRRRKRWRRSGCRTLRANSSDRTRVEN